LDACKYSNASLYKITGNFKTAENITRADDRRHGDLDGSDTALWRFSFAIF
jgi:hypothetical protein